MIAGAAVIDPGGYDNVMVTISEGEARILYRERMPIPVSMWQPWLQWTGQGGGARAHFFANAAEDLAGTRIAPLICYEQLIVWPILHSMLFSPPPSSPRATDGGPRNVDRRHPTSRRDRLGETLRATRRHGFQHIRRLSRWSIPPSSRNAAIPA